MVSKRLTYFFSFSFFLLAIIVMSVRHLGLPDLENIFKPLLLPTLMLWFAYDQRAKGIKINWIFILALFFSMLGDVFLMPLIDNFILGLVFFLISHLIYILVFLKGNTQKIKPNLKQGLLFVFIIISIYFGLLIILMPPIMELNSLVLLIAVPIYATVLLAMVLSAFVYSKVYFYQFGKFVLLGGIFFFVSDSILAINKFTLEMSLAPVLVMGTYTFAQWLLVYGYMNSKKND
ncbi:MAG: lysoplasmalogenase [Bacteroidales bacterium]|nr:lysoplasmalogenase [Bacteroidales bacterium]